MEPESLSSSLETSANPSIVPDPGPSKPGQFVTPGSRYYATGGPDPTHSYSGVDAFSPITVPNPPSEWGPIFHIELWHTSDWVIYHFKTGKAVLKRIELCLQNPSNPEVGTPVEVYIKYRGLRVAPQHDRAPSKKLWMLAGNVVIDQPGWKVYNVNVPTTPHQPPTPEEYLVAVYLKEGGFGPEPGKDRNASIAWVKVYT